MIENGMEVSVFIKLAITKAHVSLAGEGEGEGERESPKNQVIGWKVSLINMF
jgi:hypothetical protein